MEVNNNSLEKYWEKRRLNEIEKDDYDMTDYKSKVKDVCFICGRICNPDKDYNYYVKNGNACKIKCYESGIMKHRNELDRKNRERKQIVVGDWKNNAKQRKIKKT
jgi:hypothetical protein